jgi:F-type H+-transporting ATP synthase subunit e
LRWSALGLGIFYGFTHQRAITASQKAEHAQHEYEKKEKLIQQAKAEFAKKNNPTSGDSGTSNSASPQTHSSQLAAAYCTCETHNLESPQLIVYTVITDPSDPKFDLEKLLLKVQKESP